MAWWARAGTGGWCDRVGSLRKLAFVGGRAFVCARLRMGRAFVCPFCGSRQGLWDAMSLADIYVLADMRGWRVRAGLAGRRVPGGRISRSEAATVTMGGMHNWTDQRAFDALELSGAEAIGAAVRRGRLAAGLSQRQLAWRAGVSQPIISRLESGRLRGMKLRTLARIVAMLEGGLDFSRGGEPPAPTRRLPGQSPAARPEDDEPPRRPYPGTHIYPRHASGP